MTQQEIIQRVYGRHYMQLSGYIDEWGRIEVKDEMPPLREMLEEVRSTRFVFEGVEYYQPNGLSNFAPPPTPEMSVQDKEFIDNVAVQTMLFYLTLHQPTSFSESLKASRVAYRQALAMWDVKRNVLQDLADEENIKVRV